MFDTKKIKELAKEDYEKAWVETAKLLKDKGKYFNLLDKRKEHPLMDLVEKVRKVLLQTGFKETIVPMIIDKDEIYAQYGPEAPIILDRLFFLAGLTRPDIGIGKKELDKIKKIIPNFKKDKELQDIFRRYKKGDVESDNLVETIVKELDIKEEDATKILSDVFPELKKLEPVPTTLTLRSHTTAGWFGVLKETLKRESLPIQLFSIGTKFRREQKLDATHLYESLTGSIVVVAEEISIEDGKQIVKEIMSKLGFDEIKFEKKAATSKYYAPQTEFEVFIKHPKTGEYLEIGDAGFYSPVSLSNYDIPYPVWNFGFGIERILMILTGGEDIRNLVYPYLYEEVKFTDFEISNSIKLIREADTGEGKVLVRKICESALEHSEDSTPVEITVYKGEFLGKKVEVKMFKTEAEKKLLGPAALNPIVVKDGDVIGAMPGKIPEGSTRSEFTYMHGIANLLAYELEKAVEESRDEVLVEVKDVKSLTDVNMKIDDVVRRFVESNNKKIDIRGPAFVSIKVRIS